MLWRFLVLLPLLATAAGCNTLSYYTQAVRGQYQILAHRQSIEKLIANPKTPPKLKQQLELVQKLRAFAKTELKLPVDGSYAKYVDVHRKFVVWDVQAAPEFSLQPKTWRYPFLGRLAYRGYFSENDARECGERLAKQGYDVYVDGVEAYSTLGWFKDPLLNTFIDESETELADVLFHELAHKRLFAAGDTDFNEAFATAVAEEGVHRWLTAKCETSLLNAYDQSIARQNDFVHLVTATRERLQNVYAKAKNAPPDELRRQKQDVFDDLRRQYADLKARWGGYSGYDGWFAHDLNNAKLNTVANYYDYVPGFRRLLQSNGGELERFYAAAEQLAKEPIDKRHEDLRIEPQS